MRIRYCLLLFFLFVFSLVSMAVKPDAEIIYRLYALEAKRFHYPDSTIDLARISLDASLEKMFADYIAKGATASELNRKYPGIAKIVSWEKVKTKQFSFSQFRTLLSGRILAAYTANKKGHMDDKEISDLEYEIVLWLGELMKSTSTYSEILQLRYNTNSNTTNAKPDAKEETFHTLFAGRKGNTEQRKFFCETFSKGLMMMAALFEMNPATVSVITVINDKNGKTILKTYTENGKVKEVGHVCNLITKFTGERVFYDQGYILSAAEEYALVEAFDSDGNKYSLRKTADQRWYDDMFLIGQTTVDLQQIMDIEDYLSGVESYIEEMVKLKFTDPLQAEKAKASYKDVLTQVKKIPVKKLRTLSVDIVQQKYNAVVFELNYQIDQLNQISATLSENKKHNTSVAEYNRIIETYNGYVSRYREITFKNSRNIPALKAAMKKLKTECEKQVANYRNDVRFMKGTVKSDNGNVVKFSEFLSRYDKLLKDMDSILNLSPDVKHINVK